MINCWPVSCFNYIHSWYAANVLQLLFMTYYMLQLIQLYYRGKHYSNWSNVVEILLYIFAFVFVLDWNSCSRIVGYRMVMRTVS